MNKNYDYIATLHGRNVLTARQVCSRLYWLSAKSVRSYLSLGALPLSPVGYIWGSAVYDEQEVNAYVTAHDAQEKGGRV